MKSAEAQSVTIPIDNEQRVSGLLLIPERARVCYVVAHGAGAGMTHPFMNAIAEGLAQRDVATLRYQFPYMERGSKRSDSPKLAQATVRAVVGEASRLAPKLAVIAGGKSFGGRMTSQAQATAALPDIKGLVFLGFPLHAAGKPSDERGQHLFDVHIPMLFMQGTRDSLANMDLLQPLVERLGSNATLKLFPDADHSFHVPARSGRKDSEVMHDLLDSCANWIKTIV